MATMDQRMLNVEAEVNQLKGAYDHLATKVDVQKAIWQLGGLIIAAVGAGVVILKIWQ